jgi:hypothetical protein
MIDKILLFAIGVCGFSACYPFLVSDAILKKYYVVYISISILSWLVALVCVVYLILF